ncbi:MAG: hypothetical protein EPO35_02065 [Acidobacteria bacterium]|nr:MAG: hypothetical protein EPO35_02065 [Acidobacteriota bacterium]
MTSGGSEAGRGKQLVNWLLEGLLIVVSVLLAFGVDEYRDARANRELKHQVLSGIKAEIDHNFAALEPYISIHSEWRRALDTADTSRASESGLDVWFRTRPDLGKSPTPFPTLRRSAWDAAVSSGAVRLIDFNVASALADVYTAQDQVTANVQRLANGPLADAATYDPAKRPAVVRLLWLTIADIQSAEISLVKLYQQHLPTVAEAAAR